MEILLSESFSGTGIDVPPSPEYDRAVKFIRERREKQDAKWGPSKYRPAPSIAVLGEEFGEVCQAVLDGTQEELFDELLDVAAVAHAMVEAALRGDFVEG